MVKLNRKVATKVYSDLDDKSAWQCVRYHNTEIVRFNKKQIILNSDGWFTATTKKRMNQSAQEFGLDLFVYQDDGQWFVNFSNGTVVSYHDGMIIKR